MFYYLQLFIHYYKTQCQEVRKVAYIKCIHCKSVIYTTGTTKYEFHVDSSLMSNTCKYNYVMIFNN